MLMDQVARRKQKRSNAPGAGDAVFSASDGAPYQEP